MNYIIQCADSKQNNAPLLKGKIKFVSHPEFINDKNYLYVRPDDEIKDTGLTWRTYVLNNNDNQGLLKAGDLYKPQAYKKLIKAFGYEKVYILSAGWGLVRSDFRLPDYNITFSNSASKEFRRKPNDIFNDFNQFPKHEEFTFFGGLGYLDLLYKLTKRIDGNIYYATDKIEKHLGYNYVKYPRCFTNWHYEAVDDVVMFT